MVLRRTSATSPPAESSAASTGLMRVANVLYFETPEGRSELRLVDVPRRTIALAGIIRSTQQVIAECVAYELFLGHLSVRR